MRGFIGRSRELEVLGRHFQTVAQRGSGVFLSVRGRRQVGKSRLIEEFLRTAGAPAAFFSAAKGAPLIEEVNGLAAEVAGSSLEASLLFDGAYFDRWEPALRLLASTVTTPSILIIDELPYLFESEPSLEGTLQRVWDRFLSRIPIMLVAVGSDLSMMEALGRYDRPLYQRMRELVVQPLTVAETAEMLDISGADAFDAHLVLGGFPTLAESWPRSSTLPKFLSDELTDPTSPLVVVGERILAAEFPPGLQARHVLQVIGAGETTFATIGRRSGINQGSLARTLQVLAGDKRVVAVDRPLSSRSARIALYRVADPYLRFWLRFIGPNMDLLLRGRGDVVADRISQQWADYRGRAIEPLVRASVERLLPDARLGDAQHVGSYWNRTSELEVDLVGSAEAKAPAPVAFVGSIKWRERSPFDRHDLADLATARAGVPGAAGVPMIGVSREGFSTEDLDMALGPGDLLAAWTS